MSLNRMYKSEKWYTSIYGWVLFAIINMSGNLCFTMLFPYRALTIFLFFFLMYKVLNGNNLKIKYLLIIATWFILLLLPSLYVVNFSISSTLFVFLKIGVGILSFLYCRQYFCKFYVDIIFFFAVISLICFAYNSVGGILPYIPVDSTNIDGGNIYRVSSIVYTQLYNPSLGGLTLRNCGPFWEPGAYQGFLNLALLINILFNERSKYSWLKNVVFIVAIITTYSTGGYITLFLVLLYFIFFCSGWHPITRMLVTFFIMCYGIYLFNSLEFLGEKISSDESRTGISLEDFSSGAYLLFGYGYDVTSFKSSRIMTASAIINLIRYSGIVGFFMYFFPVLNQMKSIRNVLFIVVLSIILFNEPFLTEGPFWWGAPLCLSLFVKKKSMNQTKMFLMKA